MIEGAKAGDVLAGRYELREPLRAGPLGRDFCAWDRSAREDVVVTTFDQPLDPEAVSRHAPLARRAAGAHPAVPLPRQIVTASTPHFAVHDALRGADLEALRARGGALLWSRAAELVAAAAAALAAVHRATGLAHRLLHPASIWVTDASAVRVLDFGAVELAKPAPRPGPGGVFVEYRAPEQLEGGPGDARSDVFTLAVILLEAATGVHPFSGQSAFKAAHKVLHKTADALSACASGAPVPQQARALLQKALARRPDDRMADLAEFLSYLTIVRQAVGSAPPRTAKRSPTEPADTAQEATTGILREETTMIRVPGSPPSSPPAPAEPSAADLVERDHATDQGQAPPLLGGATSEPLSAETRHEPVHEPAARTAPPPTLADDANATTVFTRPGPQEKTEILPQLSSPANERTERLPGRPQRGQAEPTQLLSDTKPAGSARRPSINADATVCERRPEPQTTLLLPQSEERTLWSPPSPQTREWSNQAPVASPAPTRPSSGLLLLLNVVLIALIVCGIVALLVH